MSTLKTNNIEHLDATSPSIVVNAAGGIQVGGALTATTGTFSGNVSVAGVLSYEDVANIDSVGIITAQSGINVTGGTVVVDSGKIQSGGDPNDGSAVGSKMLQTGVIQAARASGSGASAVYMGFLQGTATATSRINANGSASFASGDAQIFDGGAAYFAGTTDIGSYVAGTSGIRLNSSGQANFTGDIIVGNGGYASQDKTGLYLAATAGFCNVYHSASNSGEFLHFTKYNASAPGNYTTQAQITDSGNATFAGGVNIGSSFDTSSASGFGIGNIITNVANNKTGCIKLQADGNNLAYYNVLEVYNGNSQSCYINANGAFVYGSLSPGGGGGGYVSKDEIAQYANSSAGSFFRGWDASGSSNALRVQLKGNGGIANYQANDVNLCDEREKKNIVSLETKWDKVKSWELKKFHYNEDADTDDLKYGVIAQQVEEHCPEVLTEWEKEEGVTRKGVKEQQMMWMAIKALQEAMTKIETLEAEVAALKGS